MRFTVVTGVAVSCSLFSQAVAQKGDVEIGVLTCSLEQPGASGSIANPVRAALCTFKPKRGIEESYDGRVQGVSLSPDKKATVIWIVKANTMMPSVPGLLQQSYAVDPKAPADQLAPLVGETNSRITLQSMTDKAEGSAAAVQKPTATGYAITSLELKLKAASG